MCDAVVRRIDDVDRLVVAVRQEYFLSTGYRNQLMSKEKKCSLAFAAVAGRTRIAVVSANTLSFCGAS